eukprot:14186036-Alexandrium_andersonii.AAC.1
MAKASHNVLNAGSPSRALNLEVSALSSGIPKYSTGPRGPLRTAPTPQGDASVVMVRNTGVRWNPTVKDRTRGP